MSEQQRKLVYDVGFHSGQDTAYYLASGFRVVAIEANPALVAEGERRFADAISDNRLILVHGCIANGKGKVDFWVNPVCSIWSSLDRDAAGRGGHLLQKVSVSTICLATLMAQHGVPWYLKVDIEGADWLCLEAISPADPPPLVSFEISSESTFEKLTTLGYTRFKLIEQSTLTALGPAISREELLLGVMCRDLKSSSLPLRVQRRLARWGMPMARLVDWMSHRDARSTALPAWKFEIGSSGPFGDDAPGRWLTVAEAASLWRWHASYRITRDSGLWCDVHAAL